MVASNYGEFLGFLLSAVEGQERPFQWIPGAGSLGWALSCLDRMSSGSSIYQRQIDACHWGTVADSTEDPDRLRKQCILVQGSLGSFALREILPGNVLWRLYLITLQSALLQNSPTEAP